MHQENRIHGNTNHTADIPWDIIFTVEGWRWQKNVTVEGVNLCMVLVKNGQANWLIFKPFNEPFICTQAIGKHQKMCGTHQALQLCPSSLHIHTGGMAPTPGWKEDVSTAKKDFLQMVIDRHTYTQILQYVWFVWYYHIYIDTNVYIYVYTYIHTIFYMIYKFW